MLKIFTLHSNDLHSADDLWVQRQKLSGGHQRLGWRQIASGYLTSVGKRRRLRLAERQLASLDDRMLKDIGIARSEIKRSVRCGRGSLFSQP